VIANGNKMNKFELYGLQRTGTTWVKNFLELNFECKEDNTYWKHTLYPKELQHPTCVIFKSPYTWIESIVYREPADLPTRYPDVLISGNHMIDNSYGECNVNIEKLVELYSIFYNNWASIADQIFVYEDLLDNIDLQIEAGKSLGLERKDAEWEDPPLGIFMQEAFTKDMYPYYKAQTPERLEGIHIELINNIIPEDYWVTTRHSKL